MVPRSRAQVKGKPLCADPVGGAEAYRARFKLLLIQTTQEHEQLFSIPR